MMSFPNAKDFFVTEDVRLDAWNHHDVSLCICDDQTVPFWLWFVIINGNLLVKFCFCLLV